MENLKKYLIILTFLISTIFFIDNVNAESIFDNLDNKYYIVHRWVKNSSSNGNNYYYVGIFNNKPTIENETISDSENIIYYKVSTSYKDLIYFIETGDTSYVNQTTTSNNSMKLNTDSKYMVFSNFDLIDENGNTYFTKNEYDSSIYDSIVEPFYDFDYGDGATKESLFTELPVIKKDISTLNDNQLANYNNILLEKENNCTDYDSYIITTTTYNGYGYTDNISLLCFNSDLNQNGEPYVAVDYGTYSGNSKYAYLYYYLMLYKSDSVDYYYTAYGTSSSGNSSQVQSGQARDDNNIYISLYGNKDIGTTFDSSSQKVLDTNIDMTFKSSDYKIVHTPTLASFKMNNIIYNEGDFGYNDGILYDKSKNTVPTISITKESENSIEVNGTQYITDITMNIEFSSIDNDKYYYLYKYGSSSEWTQMILEQNNSFSKTFSTNDILYVQILDKTTEETVISATYTIDSINYDGKPYITFGLVDSESENICITENDIHICENLIINSHITNFEQYSFYVFNNTTGESIRKFESIFKYFVYENTTIEARIVDNYTNEIVDKKTYTISSISSDSSLGQYITNDCYFATYGTNYLCNFYFYNYDSNSYQYYIGTNTSNFVELINNNTGTWLNNKLINFYLVQDNLAKLHEFSINENTTFYFKIVDKETNEVIYTKTFTIPYDIKLEESEKANLFDIFKSFINENENLKNIINQVWTSISSSAIYEYILLLIIGTLIVLIIKAANR